MNVLCIRNCSVNMTSYSHDVTEACTCKNPGLDSSDTNSFWPGSYNPSFISKVVERAVTCQLHQYRAADYLLPRFQSAYWKNHLTKTAMQRCSVSDLMYWWLQMNDWWHCWDCWTFQQLQLSTALTMPRFWNTCGLLLVWQTQSSIGCGHFWQTECSRLLECAAYSVPPMLLGVPQVSVLGPLLTLCTLLSWSLLSPFTASTCTSTPTVHRFTPAHRQGMLMQPSDVALSVSSTSRPGSRPATPTEPHQDSATLPRWTCLKVLRHRHVSTSLSRHGTLALSSTVNWCCLYRHVSQWLLPAMAATTAHQIHAIRCR